MKNILDMTITELKGLLRKKELSAVDLTTFYLERIKKYDGEILSYLRTTEDYALDMARQADTKIAQGEDAPLLGIPFGMKDILCTKGIETTF